MIKPMTGIMAKETGNTGAGKMDRTMDAGLSFPGRFRQPPRPVRLRFLLFSWLLALCLPGCIFHRNSVDHALRADQGGGLRNQGVAENYTLACPDVVDIAVAGRPDATGSRAIGPDGRIDLGRDGLGDAVRVEGQTPVEAATYVAKQLHVPPSQVHLRVAQFKSKLIYLSGEGTGVPRVVPYQGQETVLDLLRRVGGIGPDAAVGEVYVVRPHIAEGNRPEVFHVDLQGIVMKKDQHTNLRLQPFDQVYVGESRQGKLDKCLPPCLRPFHRALCGLGGLDGLEPRQGANPPILPPK
jgi:protein involved in polysaccharide export with SLBB domain